MAVLAELMDFFSTNKKAKAVKKSILITYYMVLFFKTKEVRYYVKAKELLGVLEPKLTLGGER